MRNPAQAVQELLTLLGVRGRHVVLLSALGLIYGIFEGVGLSLLLPVLQFVEQGPDGFRQSASPLSRAVIALSERLSIGSALPVLLAFVLAAVVLKQAIRYVYYIYAATVHCEAVARRRSEGFAALLRSRLSFTGAEAHGRLVSALTTELEFGAEAIPHFLKGCESVMVLTAYLILLALISPWLIPVIIGAIAALSFSMRMRVRRSHGYGARASQAIQELHTMIAERLSGIRLLKLAGQEEREASRVRQIAEAIADNSRKTARTVVSMDVSIDPLIMVLAFSTMYVAITSLHMTLASLGLIMFVLLRSVPALRQLNEARYGMNVGRESLRRVHELTERARSAGEPAGAGTRFPGLRQEIVFDRVSFSYGPGRDVLREISCRLPKGQITAVVGRSGAGKSTLFDLIPRLQEPSSGRILFDGTAATAFNVRTLRSAIGLMDQSGFLFDETVAGNIAYGLPNVDRAAIIRAATEAWAHEFITALPNGYDTPVGERGTKLSMGQRQRIALARVLLQNPDILLLDEPTSALDPESEQFIQAALDQLRRDKAIVIVAHRVSTIQRADQILVLDGGRIVEQGDHATLSKSGEVYREVFVEVS